MWDTWLRMTSISGAVREPRAPETAERVLYRRTAFAERVLYRRNRRRSTATGPVDLVLAYRQPRKDGATRKASRGPAAASRTPRAALYFRLKPAEYEPLALFEAIKNLLRLPERPINGSQASCGLAFATTGERQTARGSKEAVWRGSDDGWPWLRLAAVS